MNRFIDCLGIAGGEPPRRADRSGIVLVVVSGILALLLLLGAAFAQLAWTGRASAGTLRAAALARLAAESGMEYAHARLVQRPMPGRWDVPGRGDDWTFRQGSGVGDQGPENPSYSHGEAWIEGGTPDGIRTAADAAGPDLDGDGRFSAWTGRLRGGDGARSLPFSLRIESPEGRIPLNAGHVGQALSDGLDNDLDGAVDEADEIDLDGLLGPNGIPDHRDPAIQHHASLVAVLNNLGAILLDPTAGTRRWDAPAGADRDGDGLGDGEPRRTSWLGFDLITNRPRGGYQDWEEVERALMSLSPAPPYEGAPYRKEELDAIRPFIDLGPYEPASESSRCRYDQPMSAPSYVPVNAWAAPREVLRSLWMYLMVWSPRETLGLCYDSYRVNDCPGEPLGWGKACPRSGMRFAAIQPILWPEEAEALADRLVGLRRSGRLSWTLLHEALLREADALFAEDASALDGSPATPVLKWGWLATKAQLAFQAVTTDPYPYRGDYDGLGSWAWRWRDCVPDSGPDAAPGLQPPPSVGFEKIYRVMSPVRFERGSPPAWGPPFSWTSETPYRQAPSPCVQDSRQPVVKPQGLAISPPVRFSVASAGWTGSGAPSAAEGRLRVAERVDFTSQEDFENLSGGRLLAKRGIRVVDTPGPAARRGAVSGHSPTILSLPRPSWRAVVPDAEALKRPLNGFSRVYGALAPGEPKTGRMGAQLYWAFGEDFDGRESKGAPPPFAYTELWPDYDRTHPWPVGLEPWLDRYCRAAVGRIGDEKPGSDSPSDPRNASSGLMGCLTPLLASSDASGTGILRAFWPGVNREMPYSYDEVVRSFAVSAVMGPEASLVLTNDVYFGSGIYLWTWRGSKPGPASPGLFLRVMIYWAQPVFGTGITLKEWFIPDASLPVPHARSYRVHVAMSIRPDRTFDGLLAVDGVGAALEGPMTFRHPWKLGAGGTFGIRFTSVDEIRLYDGAVEPLRLDRFAREGTYESPLYVVDAPARLGELQWSGVVPPGLPSDCIRVRVTGYDASGNPVAALDPAGAGGEVDDFRRAPGGDAWIRSFKYWVDFDCSGAPDPFFEPPLFESIWLALRRRGYSPAWTSWSSR